MTNNDVLRRLRYTFDLNDSGMVGMFTKAEHSVIRAQISAWLKNEDAEGYVECSDSELAIFLNGLIVDKRGKKDGPQHPPEQVLNNNIIFRKLKIALNLTSGDILALMDMAKFPISEHELTAFFRKESHKNYRVCNDQVLRYFLNGLQVKLRDNVWAKASRQKKSNLKSQKNGDG